MDYSVTFSAHYPHDRFALGWEYIAPQKKYKYHTVTIYLFIITINIDYATY
jgi:hypothetical protein